jgi:helicase MOV-10
MASTASNCPNVLAHGTCDDNSCDFNHTIVTCEVCALVFKNDDDYQQHLANKKHLSRVSGRSVVSYCSVCNTNVTGGQHQWNGHVKGRKHRNKAALLKVSEVQPQIAISTGKDTFCELCQITVPNSSRNSHAQGKKHLSREVFTRYRSAVAEAEADKHDITVEGNSDFSFVPPNVAQGGIRAEISVRTTQPSTKCTLLEFKLASSQGARVITPG